MSAWKKPAKHCVKIDLDAGARELRNVHALPAQLFDFAHRRAAHSLHGHDGARAEVPVHLRHRDSGESRKFAAQLLDAPLAHQVQLLGQNVARTLRLLRAASGACRRPEALDEAAAASINARSFRDHGIIRGRRILTAASVPPGSTARCTCATDALAMGSASNFSKTFAIGLPNARSTSLPRASPWKRGTPSCSFASSSAKIRGQDVAARREHLAELTKIGPSASERQAQPHPARLAERPKEQERVQGAREAASRSERETRPARTEGYPEDLGETKKRWEPAGEAANLPELAGATRERNLPL